MLRTTSYVRTTRRVAATVAGALLTAHALGTVAHAMPGDHSPSNYAGLVFQNACTRDRQEMGRANVQNRAQLDDQVEELKGQFWRRAFTNFNRIGSIEQRWCWFGPQFGVPDGSDQ